VFIERWWGRRALIALVGFMAFNVCYLSYRNLKSFLPLTNYKTYDQELAKLDQWMMFGKVPGPFLHDLLGTTVSAHILSVIYLAYIPAVAISVAAALTFSTRLRDGYVYVAAMNWCWILGTASYYLIPTLGPFGGAPWDYDELSTTGVTRVQDALVTQRHALYSDPIGNEVVQSIAGFASLHVAVVAMAMLVAWHFRLKVLTIVLFAALVPTVIATIYFGWHYWLDDIAGLLIAWLSVRWSLWMIYPAEQRALFSRRMGKLRTLVGKPAAPSASAPPTR
jgi:membrane-associated phospholipid phosphatase